jgi:uncharacterized protein (TIGR00369 family)
MQLFNPTPISFEGQAAMKPDHLQAWLAQEAEILTRMEQGAGPGVARPEQVTNLNGLQMMQAMLQGNIPYAPIAKTLNFYLMEVSQGRAVFQGHPGPAHFNPMGTVHGGWYATLLDSALGCAVHTMMPVGRAYTTAELSVNLVRSVGHKVQRVRAEGTVIHCGRQLATAEARLIGPDGTLFAHATTTCLVFELKSGLNNTPT